MKKIAILLILSIFSFASIQKIEKEICAKILLSLFKQKSIIKVWNNSDRAFKNLNSGRFLFVRSPRQADIIIVDHYEDIKANKPIFVRKYYLLRKYKNRAVGGFYWQKGRPNIIFIKPNLKKFNIKLPSEFSDFIEESI